MSDLLCFPFCYNIVTKKFACTNHKLADLTALPVVVRNALFSHAVLSGSQTLPAPFVLLVSSHDFMEEAGGSFSIVLTCMQ